MPLYSPPSQEDRIRHFGYTECLISSFLKENQLLMMMKSGFLYTSQHWALQAPRRLSLHRMSDSGFLYISKEDRIGHFRNLGCFILPLPKKIEAFLALRMRFLLSLHRMNESGSLYTSQEDKISHFRYIGCHRKAELGTLRTSNAST